MNGFPYALVVCSIVSAPESGKIKIGRMEVTGNSTASVIHHNATHAVQARTAFPSGESPSIGISLMIINKAGPVINATLRVSF